MNYWTRQSIDFAAQRNYLDELYRVYPIVPNMRREVDNDLWGDIEESYNSRDNKNLIKSLLKLDLFPVKDSYVAYLRKDSTSIERNPNTINRIAGNLYQMPLDKIYERSSEPKETNRQIGPMFKKWLSQGTIGCPIYNNEEEFLSSTENGILNMSDDAMKRFATKYLGYTRIRKGLDFIARFNNKYVVAEAKFITDFGGHQASQFEDAVSTLNSDLVRPNRLNAEVILIAIMDGVLYIKGKNKMYEYLSSNDDKVIISSLLLREYLYSL